jgi:hypothetical protein
MTNEESPALLSGSEPVLSDDRRVWQCPHCDHCLSYRHQDRGVAELAANSHVNRQHTGAKTIVIL